MNTATDDEYLTVAEVTAQLKLNPQTVRNWIDQGSLRAVRVGVRRVRILRTDLDHLLAAGETTPRNNPQRPEPPITAHTRQQLDTALNDARGALLADRKTDLALTLKDLIDSAEQMINALDHHTHEPRSSMPRAPRTRLRPTPQRPTQRHRGGTCFR